MSYPILAPNSTWYTQGGATVARSSITQIEIKNSYTPIGTVTSSWDASAAKDGSIMAYVEGTKLTIAGNGYGRIYANANSSYAFSDTAGKDYFTSVTSMNGVDLLDTSGATTMAYMFRNAIKVKSLDLSTWNTSRVTSMYCMFSGHSTIGDMALETLNVSTWNTGEVTTMRAMFQRCSKLKTVDVSKWNTAKVTSMRNMFAYCTGLETLDVSDWNTGEVTDMNNMFADCLLLKSLDLSSWNVSNVSDMTGMFAVSDKNSRMTLYTIGDTTNWDTGNVEHMSHMFQGCSKLVSLNTSNWNTAKVTSMRNMFYACSSLEELDVSNWDVSNVTSMQSMFNCGVDYGTNAMSYTALDVSNWDTSSCTDMSFMFYGVDNPKVIDVSGWDVSNVTTFDHMFAHSYLTIGDISKWDTSSATNMNAMFYSVQNETLNVSSFNTSKVLSFGQMFESSAIEKIIGLENFDTTSALDFTQMFNNCTRLKEVNLSSFNTSKATVGADFGSGNGSTTGGTQQMFNNTPRLEKVTLGKNFSFDANGTITDPDYIGVLPTPDSTYITGADGRWYSSKGVIYSNPSDIPSLTAETYYAVAADIYAIVKGAVLSEIAEAIREANGTNTRYKLSEIPKAILALVGKT